MTTVVVDLLSEGTDMLWNGGQTSVSVKISVKVANAVGNKGKLQLNYFETAVPFDTNRGPDRIVMRRSWSQRILSRTR